MNLADHVTRIGDGEQPEWAVRCGVCEMLILMCGEDMGGVTGWLRGHHTTPLLPVALVIQMDEEDQRWRTVPDALLAARPDLVGASIHHTATGTDEPYCSFVVAAFIPDSVAAHDDALADVVTAVRAAALVACGGAEAAVLPASGDDYEAGLRRAHDDPLSCGTVAWRSAATGARQAGV